MKNLILALQTRIPAEISNAILGIPSVKASIKYCLLEELDQQCQALCNRKKSPSVLHVKRQETKEKLENYKWSDMLTFKD